METKTQETLNLHKDVALNLKKDLDMGDVTCNVVLAMDYSQSMNGLYSDGTVERTLSRILGLSLAFDDDGVVDTYLFHNSVIKDVESLRSANLSTWVNQALRKYDMGGTNYAPVINEIVRKYTTKSTLFGRRGINEPLQYPIYVAFITDGNNADHSDARQAIIRASEFGIFFQFIGIGNESFTFLQQLDTMSGRTVDNANFFKVPRLDATSDEQLYTLMLTEFKQWIPQVRALGMIK